MLKEYKCRKEGKSRYCNDTPYFYSQFYGKSRIKLIEKGCYFRRKYYIIRFD